jgi:hypothetical protein
MTSVRAQVLEREKNSRWISEQLTTGKNS